MWTNLTCRKSIQLDHHKSCNICIPSNRLRLEVDLLPPKHHLVVVHEIVLLQEGLDSTGVWSVDPSGQDWTWCGLRRRGASFCRTVPDKPWATGGSGDMCCLYLGEKEQTNMQYIPQILTARTTCRFDAISLNTSDLNKVQASAMQTMLLYQQIWVYLTNPYISLWYSLKSAWPFLLDLVYQDPQKQSPAYRSRVSSASDWEPHAASSRSSLCEPSSPSAMWGSIYLFQLLKQTKNLLRKSNSP